MLLPGLLVPPFADERYDDASLATRVGFVMAHEFMHVTAYKISGAMRTPRTCWATTRSSTQRRGHRRPGRRREPRALHYVSNETLCASVSQLFCGRVGWMPVLDEPPRGTRPRICAATTCARF